MGTPFHLLLITLILLWDSKIWNIKFGMCIASAFLIGIASEIIGVNTGWLFGSYSYTDALGITLFGVPLLIGVTWIGTTYACNVISTSWSNSTFLAAVYAALLMVLFDIVLERFATAVPLWQWAAGVIPLYNYVCWFVIGLLISGLFQYQKSIKRNVVAPYFLLSQLLFFVSYLAIKAIG